MHQTFGDIVAVSKFLEQQLDVKLLTVAFLQLVENYVLTFTAFAAVPKALAATEDSKDWLSKNLYLQRLYRLKLVFDNTVNAQLFLFGLLSTAILLHQF